MTRNQFSESLQFIQAEMARANQNQAVALLSVSTLAVVACTPNTTLSAVTDKLDRPHPSYLWRTVKHLINSGLVEQSENKQGSKVLNATKRGLRVIDGALKILGMSPNASANLAA